VHRSRLVFDLAAASLMVALGASAAYGAVPVSQDGKIGTFTIADSETTPGARCLPEP
jgi:hypothetical protein